MATYMPGNKSPREKPWLARAYANDKAKCIGYFKTRQEAEKAEEDARESQNLHVCQ